MTMLRLRMLIGIVLMMLGGLCFAGLRLAPPEDQPFVPITILLASTLGGIVQFGTAIAHSTSIRPFVIHRWTTIAHFVLLTITGIPFISTLSALSHASSHGGSFITIIITTVIVIATAISIKELKNAQG